MSADRLAKLLRLRAADPADPDVPYMIAQEHARLGRTAEALTAYDDCLTLNPDYLYAYFHRAKALEADDQLHAAIETLRHGIERARRRADAKALGELQGYLDAIQP